jgi:methionyl-tRNA formyltransferase
MTGVTTFFIDDKIDTGNILLREGIQISPFDNAGDLHDRLMKYGARLVIRTLTGIIENNIVPQPQSKFLMPGEVPKLAPRIYPENCIIDWNNDPVRIHNFIRGLAPWPGAKSFFRIGTEKVAFKIFESQPELADHKFQPGFIVSDERHFIRIACKNGFVSIANLQLEGKNRMSVLEFLRGFNITNCTITVS